MLSAVIFGPYGYVNTGIFDGCNNLKQIILVSKNWDKNDYESVFNGFSFKGTNAKVYIPCNSDYSITGSVNFPLISISGHTATLSMPSELDSHLSKVYYDVNSARKEFVVSSDSMSFSKLMDIATSYLLNYEYKLKDGLLIKDATCITTDAETLTPSISPGQTTCKVNGTSIDDSGVNIKTSGIIYDDTRYEAGATITNLKTNASYTYIPFIDYISNDDGRTIKTYMGKSTGFTTKDIDLGVSVTRETATSIYGKCTYNVGDAQFESFSISVVPVSLGSSNFALHNMEPGSSHEIWFRVDTKDGYRKAYTYKYTLPSPDLKPVAADHLSSTTAQIHATANCDEQDLTGFEWRAYDAPDLVPSTIVYSNCINGYIDVAVRGLSSSKYYKYRPFLKSAAGNMYYGDWIAFGTSDAYVYFAPVAHTYDATGVSQNSATLYGQVLAGSDDVTKQGFEYWTGSSDAKAFMGKAAAKVNQVVCSGTSFNYVLGDLAPATTYYYRAFATTSKETIYGTTMSFTTDVASGIADATALNNFRCWSDNRTIHISSEEALGGVTVYSTDGRVIAVSKEKNSEYSIPVDAGVCIVKIGGKMVKMGVR